ncbi:hypothetical protein OG792_16950 [Micromonospora sp. NBC_01699]|uniref:hypothetical protein n=1 Tax=Micromonospora sp. NBC_01699 TaxID=2975984 RepID=UPI002E336606|nr:hypothetical protein [Micromonospora sp. NBC_01699]
MPEPGDVLGVGAAASVQLRGDSGIAFRVTVVSKQLTYDGWVWLTGYVLDNKGEATVKRELFVQFDGLRLLARPHRQAPPTAQRGAAMLAPNKPPVRRPADPTTGTRR